MIVIFQLFSHKLSRSLGILTIRVSCLGHRAATVTMAVLSVLRATGTKITAAQLEPVLPLPDEDPPPVDAQSSRHQLETDIGFYFKPV